MGLISLARSPARSPFKLSLDSTERFRKRRCMPIRTYVLRYIYTTTGTRRHSGETLLLLLLNSVFALPPITDPVPCQVFDTCCRPVLHLHIRCTDTGSLPPITTCHYPPRPRSGFAAVLIEACHMEEQ
jgi:hypothetical protein